MGSDDAGVYVHRLAVRRGEIEHSGAAGPSHYVTYCEDALEGAVRAAGIDLADHDWELGLRRVLIEWQGSAARGDVLAIEVGVQRWSGASVDVGFRGTVEDVPVFEALLTFTGYRLGTHQPMPAPPVVRAALGDGPAG